MRTTAQIPELAGAAEVLSDRLPLHLARVSALLAPYKDQLEQRYDKRLRSLGFDRRQRFALSSIALAAARPTPVEFVEHLEYHGRRLAKMNLPPSSILSALNEFDELLAPVVDGLLPSESSSVRWVRDQLRLCVALTLNHAYFQVREQETRALDELSRAELESLTLADLFRSFLSVMMEACGAQAAEIHLRNEAEHWWETKAAAGCRKPKGPLEVADARRRQLAKARHIEIGEQTAGLVIDPGWRERFSSCWSVPLYERDHFVGVLQLGFGRSYEWLPREQKLLETAAERCMLAAEKLRLMDNLASSEEQIRKLAGHMLHVEEMERRRISRELHDETGQSLLCMRLQMEMLEERMPEAGGLRSRLSETRDLTERTIVEMRRLIAALSPAVLEQLGLAAALRQLVKRFRSMHPARVRLNVNRLGKLPQETEIIVYRLVQECCNNIAKHSKAQLVNISVIHADGTLRVLVEDNGIGFHVDKALAQRESFGIAGMKERVTLLGGRFHVHSVPAGASGKQGTRVSIELPVMGDGGGNSPLPGNGDEDDRGRKVATSRKE